MSKTKKIIILGQIAIMFLGFWLSGSPVSAATTAKLNIYIHKNDVNGSLWDDYQNQIHLKYSKDGSSMDTTIPNAAKLYPYGVSTRGALPPTVTSDPAFIGYNPNATAPATTTEAFASIDISGAGTYTVEIETDATQNIIRYQNDLLPSTPPADTIASYTCQDQGNTAVCKTSITVSDDDIKNASAKDQPFRIDLVVKPTANAEVRPQEDQLSAGSNAEYDELVTFVGRLAIRVQSLLNWSLQISQDSFTNPTIDGVFSKILNIVNGFFIIVLLVIAFMWNMSVLISRRYLRKIVIMFIFAVVLVNFSLPVNKLLINLTNVLQNSFLVKDVVVDNGGVKTTVKSKITSNDILSVYDADYGAFVGLSKSDYLAKTYPTQGTPSVFPSNDPSTQFNDRPDLYVNRNQEPIYFNIALVLLGTLGQLLLALIILFRIIILWFLLILSPFLFLLVLLKFLKQFFKYWSWLYFRWLFIGPLLAICLFIIINIWSITGVPIESSFTPPASLWFQNATNLYLSAPGVVSGFLNGPREVMKYIAALLMLYMAVILPFWLTRRFEIFDWQWDKLTARVKNKVKIPPIKPKTPVLPTSPTSPMPINFENILPNLKTKVNQPVQTELNPNIPQQQITTLPIDTTMLQETRSTTPVDTTALQEALKTVPAEMQATVQAEGSIAHSATIENEANITNQVEASVGVSQAMDINLSDTKLDAKLKTMDTTNLLSKMNMVPLTNEKRNSAIDVMATRDSVKNETQRQNLNKIYDTLDSRAERNDLVAQTAMSDIRQAEKYYKDLSQESRTTEQQSQSLSQKTQQEIASLAGSESSNVSRLSTETVKALGVGQEAASGAVQAATEEETLYRDQTNKSQNLKYMAAEETEEEGPSRPLAESKQGSLSLAGQSGEKIAQVEGNAPMAQLQGGVQKEPEKTIYEEGEGVDATLYRNDKTAATNSRVMSETLDDLETEGEVASSKTANKSKNATNDVAVNVTQQAALEENRVSNADTSETINTSSDRVENKVANKIEDVSVNVTKQAAAQLEGETDETLEVTAEAAADQKMLEKGKTALGKKAETKQVAVKDAKDEDDKDVEFLDKPKSQKPKEKTMAEDLDDDKNKKKKK